MMHDRRSASDEIGLLCALAGPHPDLVHARALLQTGIDFSALLELAHAHRMRPHLLLGLSRLSWESVPAAARIALEDFRRHHLLRALYLADEAGRLSVALAAQGIRHAFFKGAVLAIDLQGDLSQREYADIDLIVPPGEVARAEAVLRRLGYADRQGDRAFRAAFLAYQRQYSFVRIDIDAEVDLHWGFTVAQLPFPLRPDDIWSGLKRIRLGRHAVPTLSDAHLALLLAGHGTKERWRSLGWLSDFALLVDRRAGLDWAALHVAARRQGCGDALLLGGVLAERLLRTPIPRALASAAAQSRRVQRLAGAIAESLRHTAAATNGPQNLADLDLCDRRRDRVRAAFGLAVTPTSGDYSALPLPRPLWPAYHLLRPVRLAAKGLAALLVRFMPRQLPAAGRAGAASGRSARRHRTS
jgi:hypothetical protein